MSRRLAAVVIASLGIAVAGTISASPAADGERQYRVALRLAGEQSASAAEAFAEVLRLDPGGEFVDDALVELARLERPARWPEELGRMTEVAASAGLQHLERVREEVPRSSRRLEVEWLRAMFLLEPVGSRDVEAASRSLVSVAAATDRPEFSVPARYTLAWLDGLSGRTEPACDTYGRLVVDRELDRVLPLAMVGLGRCYLREQRHGQAARCFDEARALSSDIRDEANALAELAVRALVRKSGSAAATVQIEAVAVVPSPRSPAAFAVTPASGIVLADRREDRVLRLAASGNPDGLWAIAEPDAVAVDGLGRIFAMTGDRIYRLPESGDPVAVAVAEDWKSPRSLLADSAGGLWLLGRKGERIGRLAPGGNEVETARVLEDVRLASLALDGTRLLGVDTRGAAILVLERDGELSLRAIDDLSRPQGVAVDAAGRMAVLHGRDLALLLVDPSGDRVSVDLREAGLLRPAAMGFGPDGVLHLIDASRGEWVRVR